METLTAVPAEPLLPVARKRGRPRDPAADIKILSAAAELILARGFDAMTVDEVASRARVGKATVYRRWARKEDLALAAMERLYRTEVPIPDTGTLRNDLVAVYTSVLTFANSPAGQEFLRTLVVESVRDARIAALYRAAAEKVESRAVAMFDRAIERGEVRPDVDLAGAMNALSGQLALSLVAGRPLPDVDQAETMVDTLLHGIMA